MTPQSLIRFPTGFAIGFPAGGCGASRLPSSNNAPAVQLRAIAPGFQEPNQTEITMTDTNPAVPETPEGEFAIRGGLELDPVLRSIYLKHCAKPAQPERPQPAPTSPPLSNLTRI